jgi:hypothetical protein
MRNDGAPIRLVPRQPVFLSADGEVGGERFARLFRETWGRLPRYARRRILRVWRGLLAWGSPLAEAPRIELVDAWTAAEGERDPSVAQVARQGAGARLLAMQLRFRAAAIERLPDALVMAAIAHELAHVEIRWRAPCQDGWWEEELVRQTVAGWGFDQEGVDAWLRANRRWLRSQAEQAA